MSGDVPTRFAWFRRGLSGEPFPIILVRPMPQRKSSRLVCPIALCLALFLTTLFAVGLIARCSKRRLRGTPTRRSSLGQPWHVHDSNRPHPNPVSPGKVLGALRLRMPRYSSTARTFRAGCSTAAEPTAARMSTPNGKLPTAISSAPPAPGRSSPAISSAMYSCTSSGWNRPTSKGRTRTAATAAFYSWTVTRYRYWRAPTA